MRIGVPRETKDQEGRVSLEPAGVTQLVAAGHDVVVETQAGVESGFTDSGYADAGGHLGSADDAWATDLVVKVKEPLESEYRFLRGQILFTYLHLAGVAPQLTETLLSSGTTAIAYETVENVTGALPLLAPMSGVAGHMATLMGTHYLAKTRGGRGTLLGRILGQAYGRVLVVGDGVVGRHAARAAAALGAQVAIAGRHPDRLPDLRRAISDDIEFVLSEPEAIAARVRECDLVVGAVLRRGARAPYVVTEAMVATMPEGAVIVDVSIDQGGCVETARPTSHSDPVYVTHGVVHYCVTNMPGAYPRTSTLALTAATGPYVRALADRGLDVLRDDPGFARGLNTAGGHLRYLAVAEALGRTDAYRPWPDA
jgi:alanine dehydrogenase